MAALLLLGGRYYSISRHEDGERDHVTLSIEVKPHEAEEFARAIGWQPTRATISTEMRLELHLSLEELAELEIHAAAVTNVEGGIQLRLPVESKRS